MTASFPTVYVPPKMAVSRSGLIKLADMAYDPTSPVAQYLVSLQSEASQRTSYRRLRQFAIWRFGDLRALPEQIVWSTIQLTHLQEYQLYLQYKPNPRNPSEIRALASTTINSYLIAVKGVMKKAARLSTIAPQHKVSTETWNDVQELKLSTAQPLPKSRSLTDDEVSTFMASFKGHGKHDVKKNKNLRDQALFYMMAGAGLRVSEVASLMLPKNMLLEIPAIQLFGKGAKERRVPLGEEVNTALTVYLNEVRGETPGPLFFSINRHGQLNTDKAITAGGIRDMLKARGFTLDSHITPHYLRKHFGTTLLANHTDVLTVRKLLGHANVNTTQIYDTRDDKAQADAVEVVTLQKNTP